MLTKPLESNLLVGNPINMLQLNVNIISCSVNDLNMSLSTYLCVEICLVLTESIFNTDLGITCKL